MAPQDFSCYDNVEVDIEVDWKPLIQYKSPDPSEADRPGRKIRYIEARDGQEFAISTTFPTNFDWGQSTCVKRFVTCDGHRLPARRTHKTSKHYYHRQQFFRYVCPSTGTCKKSALHFRELDVQEYGSPSTDIDALQKVGKIVVELQRRTFKTITPEPLKHDYKPFVSSASEKAIACYEIPSTVTVDYTNERPSTFEMQNNKSVEIPGEKGFTYEFRYRSREALESLGCIPIETGYTEVVMLPKPKPTRSARTWWLRLRNFMCAPAAETLQPPEYSEKA